MTTHGADVEIQFLKTESKKTTARTSNKKKHGNGTGEESLLWDWDRTGVFLRECDGTGVKIHLIMSVLHVQV